MKNRFEQLLYRADIYRLLALGFDFPSPSVVDSIRGLSRDLADLPMADDGERSLLEELSRNVVGRGTEREAEYHRLFGTQVLVPPSEGSYIRAERGPVLGDIVSFYRAFHVRSVPGNGPPDSIKMELGFMSLLCLKQGSALQDGEAEWVERTLEAEKYFVSEHLGRWVFLFAERLLEATDDPTYRLLGRLLKEWMQKECARLGLVPGPLSDSGPRPMDEEEFRCAGSFRV